MANNSDIYTNAFTETRSITTSGALITWSDGGQGAGSKLPLLMSGLKAQYGRNVSPVFPINLDAAGANTRLNIVGSPSGTLQCSGLLTPDAEDMTSFLRAVGKACVPKGEHVTIDMTPFSNDNCGTGARVTYRIKGLLLLTMGVEIQGGGEGGVVMVSMPLLFTFSSMSPTISGGSGGGPGAAAGGFTA